jgi:hypothetical protein
MVALYNYSRWCYTRVMIKLFIAATIDLVKQSICSHKETFDASCPFTMRTYTSCIKCTKRLRSVSNL